MQAAEHGADFPLAARLRRTMTHSQLHDFAAGSERGKPQHVGRALHPALAKRAQMASEAHAHLTAALPGYTSLPMPTKMAAIQHHIRTRLKIGR